MSAISKLVCVSLLVGTGCYPEPVASDVVSDLCTRLDNCNYLPDGVSHQACVDNRNACVKQLTVSQREDWIVLMESCLELQSCPLYGDCWADVPWC